MGIKLFVTITFLISLGFYFLPVANDTTKEDVKDIPLIEFDNPKMFTLNKTDLTKIVLAKKAIRYASRDEMFEGDITLKNQNKNQDYTLENISADLIISQGNILTFKNNVNYRRDGFVNLKTEELYYNTKQQTAYNSVDYKGWYYDNYVTGSNLYVDSVNKKIKSQNSHFEINMKNN
ncbi:MAG: hypothetical protein ACQERD_05525 [Campylobacterota bacterium]